MILFPQAGLAPAALILAGFLAIVAAPAGASAQESLADLPEFREGCQALADERFETAVRHFEACWGIIEAGESGDAEENLVAGRLLEALVRGGSPRAAIQWVREHPLLQPSPGTSRWIALAFQKEERFDEAADSYNLYLSGVPRADNTTHLNRAICLVRSGKAASAFELVRDSVTPATPLETLRLAQIAAAAGHDEVAVEHLGNIPDEATAAPALRFPLARLHAAIRMRAGKRTAAFATVYELIETSPDPAAARLAFLLLEQLLEDGSSPDLADRLAAWAAAADSPGREAASLFRILLLHGEEDHKRETLREFAKTSVDPELREECRLRLAELAGPADSASSTGPVPAEPDLAPDLRRRIRFAAVKAVYDAGDFALAARKCIESADARTGGERGLYLYNAALCALQSDDSTAFAAYEEALARNNPRSPFLADLSYLGGLYFASKGDSRAFERLNAFTREHPDHPANVEAQLALAEIHLNQAPARPRAARAIFEGLRTRPLTLIQSERLDYTSIWVEQTDGDAPALIRRAEDFIRDWPSSAYLPEVVMLLAAKHHQLKNHRAAGECFALVATRFPNSSYADTARFFAAATAPPGEEAIARWQQLIADGGTFAAEARHELGLLYLSLDRFAEAAAEFKQLIESLAAGEPLRHAAMADLGEVSYLEALADDQNPAKLEEAANLFAALSGNAAAPAFWRYNAAVRRGKCLEALDRDSIALEIYRSIVEEQKTDPSGSGEGPPPRETEWVFRAGFAAIEILGSEKNWPAAIGVADALSDKSGPRAIEAARLAERLRLQHWVWE
ncbi:MAG: hypothetical protein GXX91_13930 [Verrucomicrobiaceae bacterium]|nr:hypothetical protein [Verrucomicrobiaceae bacterium]